MKKPIGELPAGRKEIIVMTWMEIRSDDDFLDSARSYMITRFKEIYKSFTKGGKTFFELSDGCTMHIDTMHSKDFECLVMVYVSENDNDDGDQYWPEDFETPNDMLEAMLAETKL
jgi:hypothetical protein